jgi:hypothetical protein
MSCWSTLCRTLYHFLRSCVTAVLGLVAFCFLLPSVPVATLVFATQQTFTVAATRSGCLTAKEAEAAATRWFFGAQSPCQIDDATTRQISGYTEANRHMSPLRNYLHVTTSTV